MILCCALLAAGTAANAANGTFGGGNGSTGSPYIVQDAADLNAMRNGLGLHYRLGNDIDLTTYLSNGNPGYNAGAGWEPIGTYSPSAPFTGSLDGAGYKITGLWINRTSTNYVGLFGYIKEALIENLGVEIAAAGVNGERYVGGLVGANNRCIVSNCYAIGKSTSTDAGGLMVMVLMWGFSTVFSIVKPSR